VHRIDRQTELSGQKLTRCLWLSTSSATLPPSICHGLRPQVPERVRYSRQCCEEYAAISQSQSAIIGNRLLAALAPDVQAQLMPKLTPHNLTLRQVLYRSEGPIDAVYFPLAGMVSMVAELDDGMQAEVGIIGREGATGTALLAGVETTFVEAMVQVAGPALRMETRMFQREMETNAPLRKLLFRYHEVLQSQISQTAACNGRHGLEQRLARWLLMAHDRVGKDMLPLTQDFVAMMLGVHRPSITVTAGILQRAGLIRYSAGIITVLDRASLEASSCECYAVVRRRAAILLGPPTP
jgi:CRP-like cAMP-binding protein